MTLAIYIHWPFCKKKCPYCDFNSHVKDNINHDRWAKALARQLEKYAAETREKKVSSVFFGGGTPSLMQASTIQQCLSSIRDNWDVCDDLEISMEANPTSSEAEKFLTFKQAGINRLSIGVQSFDDEALKFLGREHNAKEAQETIALAASIFDRFSFDLIYGRPQQTPQQWQKELESALAFKPEHISVYQLTIEQGTAFYTAYNRGEFHMPDGDLEAEFYEVTGKVLSKAGLARYEISNHALLGQECRHNMAYWQYNDYIGVGPGAHGRFVDRQGVRYGTREHNAPDIWLERQLGDENVEHEREVISSEMAFEEMLLMGLRLEKGIRLSDIQDKTGYHLKDKIDPRKLVQMQDEGYITLDHERIVATENGFRTLNSLLSYLLA